MIWIYAAILIVSVVLWIIAKVMIVSSPKVDCSYSKPFLAPAVLICKWAHRIKIRVNPNKNGRSAILDHKLKTQLHKLNPGEQSDSLLYKYKIEKLSTFLLIVFVGSLLGMFVSLVAERNTVLVESNKINRNEYGQTSVNANLIAGIEQDDGKLSNTDINISVEARNYSYEEADELYSQMEETIDELILGENKTADHIVSPLKLVKQVEGYPFTIDWECDNYEYMDMDGSIHNTDLEKPVLVNVYGDCSYENNHWYILRTYRICPPDYTDAEILQNELMKQINIADENTATKDQLVLPQYLNGNKIIWNESIEDESPLVLLAIVIICILISPLKESELKSALNKRNKELLIAYPAFISKLTLYLSAGMSVRNCFLTLGKNSENRPEKDRNALEKELIITSHELQMGISEPEAYERLGKRCGSREYTRFSTLLVQNLRKGSTDLLTVLSDEARDAFVLRKNEARKLGEEASTKLLLPMVMMLAVVMIIIMVPAYMSFSS